MRKLLFINPFGIGDVVFSLWVVEKIRSAYPDAQIGFVGNERTADLLGLCPAVNRVHVFNRDALRAILQTSPLLFLKEIGRITGEIKKEKYSTLIDFSFGREFAFAGWVGGIRQRIGFDYKGRGLFLTLKKKISSYEGRPVTEHQIDLLKECGLLTDNILPDQISVLAQAVDAQVAAGLKVLAVVPGGGRSWGADAGFKQWEPEKFSELCIRARQARPGLRIVLLGDKDETPLLQAVKDSAGSIDTTIMAGESIAGVCAILKRADIVLGNDGGLMHLANALGTPTVTIFGPVDEAAYSPYGGKAVRRLVTAAVECRPCYQNFHFPHCAHKRRCLAEISVDKVIEPVLEIL